MWLWLVAAGMPLLGSPAHADEKTSTGERAEAVARVVHGILSYTHWPDGRASVRMCVLGPTEYADELLANSSQDIGRRRMEVLRITSDLAQEALPACDGLYLGRVDAQALRALTAPIKDRPMLTISEDVELCRIGVMFCLRFDSERAGFEMNLDSVARSGLKISPKVLYLAGQKSSLRALP
ncbi:YfiR family protein [Ottowia sp. VDI28]|uniref:YfiR family protein n=1 Tax=Ottowia sp. VDI28 TaxID=3133968 RepID=UPI003C2C2C86